MVAPITGRPAEPLRADDMAAIQEIDDLTAMLRRLRRREARLRGGPELTYRQIAARIGGSPTTVGNYLSGATLPPTERFDALVRSFGATPAEQGPLATARDRVEEWSRGEPPRPHPPIDHPAVQHDGRVPRQLPPPVRNLVGRLPELAELTRLSATAAGSTAVAVIDGTAGVGKTALAVYAAHRFAGQFPDGQLYVDLKGFGPAGTALEPGDAIRDLLDAMAVPAGRVPPTLPARTGLYRSAMAGRRMLILLDNARDAAQVRPLLPGTPGCLVLVTSRNRLGGLVAADGAHALTLDVLSTSEARELLVARLSAADAEDEPGSVDRIIARCGRLPLALTVVAARAAAPPRRSLAAIAGELHCSGTVLDALDTGDPLTDVRSVLSWSVRDLGAGAARLLRLLGLHPGPDVSVAAAASLSGAPVRQVGGLLTELSRANLVTEHAPGRYTFHDVLRTYASELAARHDGERDRRAATRRCLDHYLHAAHDAAMLLDAHRTPLTMPVPQPGVSPETATDYAAAVRWFGAEYRVLLGAVDLALAAGYETHTWQLAWTLVTFLDRQGRWPELIAVQGAALTAARRLADLPGQARAHSALGRAHAMSGHARQAETHLSGALRMYGELNDAAGSSCAHLDLATLRAMGGGDRSALRHAERALDLYRTVGHRTGAPRALQVIGRQHARLGAYRNGLDHLHRACRLQEAGGDQRGNQETWRTLGGVYHRLGRYPEASSCYRRAADLCHGLGDRYYEADALRLLGRTRYAAGEVDWARASWGEALTILEELAHPAAIAVRADLRDPAAVGPPVV